MEIAEDGPEERMEEYLGMSAGQSGVSEEQASVESEDDNSIPLNYYPRSERRRKTLTYDSLGQPSVVKVAIDRLNVSRESAVQRLWQPWTMLVTS